MLFKNILLLTALCAAPMESAKTNTKTFEDYIDAIRKASKMPAGFGNNLKADEHGPSSLVEVENLKKPLTVSQFSEWLHNLYYDEEKKRKSAIKYVLEHQFGQPSE
jgi:hypothetical protein